MNLNDAGSFAMIILCLFIVGPFVLVVGGFLQLLYPDMIQVVLITLGLIIFGKALCQVKDPTP